MSHQSKPGSPMSTVTESGPARRAARVPAAVSSRAVSRPDSSIAIQATQRVALPHASASPPSALRIASARVGRAVRRRAEHDQLIAADAGAPMRDRAHFIGAERDLPPPRVENHEVVAEPVHLDEFGSLHGGRNIVPKARKSRSPMWRPDTGPSGYSG